MRSYLNILIFILLMSSCSEDEEITYGVSEPEIDQNTGTSDNYVKDILKEKNYDINSIITFLRVIFFTCPLRYST